jgi:endonuclease YncB( thermonuclease family)
MRIVDGDTIHFLPDKADKQRALFEGIQTGTPPVAGSDVLKIRFVGIDTPESHLPTPDGHWVGQGDWGNQATAFLKTLINTGDKVNVLTFGTDKYGRTIGRVYKGTQDINLIEARAGWAAPYMICGEPECGQDFNDKYEVDTYMRACVEARNQGLGIYNTQNPLKELPFEFRLRMQQRTADKYVGDYYTHRLYEPTEYNQVDICRRIFFMSKDAALKLGYAE